jgi:hypothetical protein
MRTVLSPLVLPLALGAAFLLSLPAPAHGQGELSGSQSVLFDPSIEASGMGGGGVAYLWRDEPNSWANPALLGAQEGLRYSYGTTRIAPVILEDAHIKSHRFSLGHGGVGLLIAGKPLEDVGKDIQLDYGPVEFTDIDGNVIQLEPTDEVRSIGVGVSVLDLVSSVLAATGSEPIALRRYVALMVGHTWKDFEIDFGPFGRGEGEQKDRGAAIRISPVDQIGDDLLEPSERTRFRLDFSGGYAQLNYEEGGGVVFEGVSSDPVFELRRAGGAGRLTVAFPTQRTGWIHDFVSPTVSLGVSWESSDYYDDGESFGLDIVRTGQELVVADVLYLRHGHVEDDAFPVEDETWGIGVSLRYRQTVGIRFDYGEYPYARTVELDGSVDRYGITAFVDPFRLMAAK